MKKISAIIVCLLAMMAASTGLRAQVTITLEPEWNWISFPIVEETSIDDVLAGFEPEFGDGIASFDGYTDYLGEWTGDFTTLLPGHGYMYYSVRTETVSFVVNTQFSSLTVTTSEPTDITYYSAVCGGTVTVAEGDHVFLRGICWGTEPNPTIDDSHTTDETGTGYWSTTLYGLTMGTTYHVRAYAVSDQGLRYGEDFSLTTETISNIDHDFVDLGLPSGRLWATCNIGANEPEDYGNYFAWGETQPKGSYNWSTYQYCNGSSDTDPQLTKYCFDDRYGYEGYTDDLTTLLPEDDAATANWGAKWRMPTVEEWQELCDNTTITWTSQNGVNGTLFTASNGNSLFLPAAGVCSEGAPVTGIAVMYWSSSLYEHLTIRAKAFSNDDTEWSEIFGGRRFLGYSVRAVLVPEQIHDFVDLGLPNGTLWATCNVGASAPEEYGDYFAWGETQSKDYYAWDNYQYCNGDYNTLTKYCSNSNYGYNGYTDNLNVLQSDDDVAMANWGNEWRVPTRAEWQELFDNTTVTWTSQNGVSGRLFTAANGNSLFLPATGLIDESGNLIMDGLYGNYWSSSLNTDSPYGAWDFTFYSEDSGMYSITRNSGRSVRPVRAIAQNVDYSNLLINELNGTDKFIELYNQGDVDLPLEGVYLMKDDNSDPIWTADASVMIPAHGYVLLYSTDVEADHSEHAANLFFNSGLSPKKTIRFALYMPDGTERDVFTRGNTGGWGDGISNVAPLSYARTPDGGDWKLTDPTPGAANPSEGEDIPQD